MERIGNKFIPVDIKLSNGTSKQLNNTPLKGKVFVAMSGGVDSSVTALLLKKQGYDLVGVYMKNWTPSQDAPQESCAWLTDKRDAIRVCAFLDIPFLMFDFEKEYRALVVEYLFREYAEGRTPNPDILCNQLIKFDLFLQQALAMGASVIATGHYARKETISGSNAQKLFIPKDQHKDQTYFLYTLTQEQLSYTIFPLAGYFKTEVRKLAKKQKLPTADKKDSQGICFVGQVPIEQFLRQKLPLKPGDVVDHSGKVIGRHHGVYFYTLGQRHGFEVKNKSDQSPVYYIIAKDRTRNTLTVAPRAQYQRFWRRSITVAEIHWISGQAPNLPLQCKARIRHGQPLQSVCVIKKQKSLDVVFDEPQPGVAVGQSLVLYQDNEVLGGGIIE